MYIESDLVERYAHVHMKTISIFIFYAHENRNLRRELEGHLAFLRASGHCIWQDRKILAGQRWAEELDQNLGRCGLILLLISSSFLGSSYCSDVEFRRAMHRHRAGEAVVILILLRAVFWDLGERHDLQAVPRDGRAVLSCHWQNRDAALRMVAAEICLIVVGSEPALPLSLVSVRREPAPDVLAERAFDALYHELARLDYRAQRQLFKQFREADSRVAAFLLSGEPECAERWLLNRVLRPLIDGVAGRAPYRFSFARKGGGWGLDDLWRNLGEWCGFTDACSPLILAEAIHMLWQTRTIILLVHGLHEIEQQYIEACLDAFWQPLATMARERPASRKHSCVLFLVDERGSDWTLPCARQIDPVWVAGILLEMERLTRFPREELRRWLEAGIAVLRLDELLAACEDGLPELVLRRVCTLCGDDWHRREKAWISTEEGNVSLFLQDTASRGWHACMGSQTSVHQVEMNGKGREQKHA